MSTVRADAARETEASRSARSPRFFQAMAVVALFALIVGFGSTYFAPLARGTFDGPTALHVHGAFAMGSVLLFAAQAWLVRLRRVRLHRALGRIGLRWAARLSYSSNRLNLSCSIAHRGVP